MLARSTSRPVLEIPPPRRELKPLPRIRPAGTRAGVRRAEVEHARAEAVRELRPTADVRSRVDELREVVRAALREDDADVSADDDLDVRADDRADVRVRAARPVFAVALFCVLAAAISAQSVV